MGNVAGVASVLIVEATAADAAALAALWEACGLTRAWNPPARDIALAQAQDNAAILLARRGETPVDAPIVGGAIVGSVMVGFDGHRGWIYYLAVAPDARRGGLGRALMQAAETWLRARGAPKIQLMVRDGNDAALAFYRALGFADQPVAVLGRMLD